MPHSGLAAYYVVAVCEDCGEPVIAFADAEGNEFASAHIHPDGIEELVASLRKAVEIGAAMRRPVA